jgi:hypothetical protein
MSKPLFDGQSLQKHRTGYGSKANATEMRKKKILTVNSRLEYKTRRFKPKVKGQKSFQSGKAVIRTKSKKDQNQPFETHSMVQRNVSVLLCFGYGEY